MGEDIGEFPHDHGRSERVASTVEENIKTGDGSGSDFATSFFRWERDGGIHRANDDAIGLRGVIATRIADRGINPVLIILIFDRPHWALGQAAIAEDATVGNEIGHDAEEGFRR